MNNNFTPIHCAEHLQLAMQLVGKSATELLAILSNKKILLSNDYLEISLGKVTLSGILNSRGLLEKVRFFTDVSVEGVLTVS